MVMIGNASAEISQPASGLVLECETTSNEIGNPKRPSSYNSKPIHFIYVFDFVSPNEVIFYGKDFPQGADQEESRLRVTTTQTTYILQSKDNVSDHFFFKGSINRVSGAFSAVKELRVNSDNLSQYGTCAAVNNKNKF